MTARAAPSAARSTSPPKTVAELIDRLGGIPAERIRMIPPPGTATEADLEANTGPTCELIDGTLVEKAMGIEESFLAVNLIRLIANYVTANRLGRVSAPDGHMQVRGGTTRAPDVTFTPKANFVGPDRPRGASQVVPPGLVVEVLSPSNTPKEIRMKLDDLFAAGCQLAWVIDPPTRTAKVYTSADQFTELDEAGVLDGGAVLPGFRLPLADVFADTM